MAALLGLSQAVLPVTDMALAACAILLYIVYVVRLVVRRGAGASSSAPIRVSRMNMKLFAVISVVLGIGYISFMGVGTFTNRPLPSQIGYLFLSLYLIYVMAMALSYG